MPLIGMFPAILAWNSPNGNKKSFIFHLNFAQSERI